MIGTRNAGSGISKCLIMALLFVLPACATTLPRTVEVPVAVPCPAPPEIARPRLPLKTLRPDSPPAEVIRAYAESLEAVAGYAEQLETILEGYRGR